MARKDNGKKSTKSSPTKTKSNNVKSQPSKEVKVETKQPGLLAQAASTASGVAVGSVIGKSITDTFSGSSKLNSQEKPKCDVELKNFFDCYTQNKTTGTFKQCESFMESLFKCFNKTY
uniref:CHCH domain-containing protein n=1 Tax=Strongyloides stercoralis TaxID=6248 RepID=A0A0K0ELW9_STRER